MWRRVDLVLTDVSEKHIASIFRVDCSLQPPAHVGCSLVDIFTLKMDGGPYIGTLYEQDLLLTFSGNYCTEAAVTVH
jgi:hypothetical protein